MELNMPKSEEPTSASRVSNIITLVFGKDYQLFWYQKELVKVGAEDLIETDYSPSGISQVMIQKKKQA
jgi:hypothetical protein